ncbi:MAG: ANTAR domain-containing protein [Clostridia bacterium]|nr:ANTAR domain-containing protein [Clostridia bacterium]MEE1126416.1 ANTAR domain-containing protein [Acutalibacteraceae bacterium]
MKRALVISKNERNAQAIKVLLEQEGYTELSIATSAVEAKKCIAVDDFNLIFIYTPLEDEVGLNLSIYLAERTHAGVFIALSEKSALQMQERLSASGVVTLNKPLTAEVLHQSILVWNALAVRINLLERENVQLKSRLEEIKLIDRAKCVLMQCLAMSEPQAHKFIERQAMDLRISKKRVAEQVLNTYEI